MVSTNPHQSAVPAWPSHQKAKQINLSVRLVHTMSFSRIEGFGPPRAKDISSEKAAGSTRLAWSQLRDCGNQESIIDAEVQYTAPTTHRSKQHNHESSRLISGNQIWESEILEMLEGMRIELFAFSILWCVELWKMKFETVKVWNSKLEKWRFGTWKFNKSGMRASGIWKLKSW